MRREILGILLFFLVVFTLISLLSYSPDDPSIHHARSMGRIHNLFGWVGAHAAGFLIGAFGIGAFWIPVLFLLASLHFFSGQPGRIRISHVAGGILLVVATGSLLALKQKNYSVFGTSFSAGGGIGIPVKDFLIRYTNITGAAMILASAWIIGLITATRFSLFRFFGSMGSTVGEAAGRLIAGLHARRELKREKVRKRERIKRESQKTSELTINTPPPPKPKPVKEVSPPRQELFEFMRDDHGFHLPPVGFLEEPDAKLSATDTENLKVQSRLLEKKLEDFGVNGKVVAVTPGPVITTFEYEPAPGVKINKVVNLADDLSLALRALSIRIVAPIPGKAVIGIEIPNAVRETVRFKEIVVSPAFEKSKSRLTLCLGKDIVGVPAVAELERMPHLLIAGATGSGKSVALNSMICSLLYKATPEDVKMILIDPKRIELSVYDGIPHLITPVVTDVKKATHALFWAVKEMERRYEILSEKKAKNITQFNQKAEKEAKKDEPPPERLPLIVIIIDELADLMMVASRDVEVALMRLAQMARAAGIHLILATQRPSVDVLTGIIKANFPTRLSFQVSSKTDSRTIIDANGAESLLGSGDMLFMPPGTGKLTRIHGAYISEAEIARVTDFLKTQKQPDYDHAVVEAPPEEKNGTDESEYDERYDEAVALVTRTRQASISMVQRHLRIGYNRAARIIEVMEKEGVVGPSDGVKPREVLVPGYDERS